MLVVNNNENGKQEICRVNLSVVNQTGPQYCVLLGNKLSCCQ